MKSINEHGYFYARARQGGGRFFCPTHPSPSAEQLGFFFFRSNYFKKKGKRASKKVKDKKKKKWRSIRGDGVMRRTGMALLAMTCSKQSSEGMLARCFSR